MIHFNKQTTHALLLATLLAGCQSQQPLRTTSHVAANAGHWATARPADDKGQTVSNDKSIVILYENDVHCNISGYAKMAGLRDAIRDTAYCELTSSGDFLQGGSYGSLSKGQYIVDVMKEMDYAAVALGNHEFDFSLHHTHELLSMLEAPITCVNLCETKSGRPLYNPHVIKRLGNKNVAFIGVLTPTTLYTEEAAFYQNGKQVAELKEKTLYEEVQKAVDEVRSLGADYVILLSHVGEDKNRCNAVSHDLAKATTGIDVILDGHTHSFVPSVTVPSKDNKRNVLITQTGTQFKNIGKLVITPDGKMTTELIPTETISYRNKRVQEVTDSIDNLYKQQVGRVICTTDFSLPIRNEQGRQLIRLEECALGDLVCDAYRTLSDADFAVCNGGGIRTAINAGNVTLGDIIGVLPYENNLCVVEASGQKILDMLNKVVEQLPLESGDFPQCSGINFTINMNATPRIQDASILDKKTGNYKPINPSQNYKVATMDYCVTGGGLGRVLRDAKFLKENIMLYSEALTQYVKENLHGKIPAQYAKPAGRIKIIK